MELSSKILSDITVHMKYARYLESEERPGMKLLLEIKICISKNSLF